jgi:hypothetical protein
MGAMYDDIRHHHLTLDGFWSGKIAVTPASVNLPTEVTLNAFDRNLRWGPAKWQPFGTEKPQRGDECLVVFDEKQRPYVVIWWGDNVQGPGG